MEERLFLPVGTDRRSIEKSYGCIDFSIGSLRQRLEDILIAVLRFLRKGSMILFNKMENVFHMKRKIKKQGGTVFNESKRERLS